MVGVLLQPKICATGCRHTVADVITRLVLACVPSLCVHFAGVCQESVYMNLIVVSDTFFVGGLPPVFHGHAYIHHNML